MNILFLTMTRFPDIRVTGIYGDLMRKFRDEGHSVYVVNPVERREHMATGITESDGVHVLSVRSLNVQKTNVVEKGLGQVLIEPLFRRAIRKYFAGVKFDLVLYSTPPITLAGAVKWVKKHNPGAMSYLMLKDIFPQNALDIGMLSDTGVKSILLRSFRRKEKALYGVSDYIGCMSPANVKYVIEHNPEVNPELVELCPNSFAADGAAEVGEEEKKAVRIRYNLPVDKPIFFYGGNLGKPQGIPFLVECLKANCGRTDCHFIIVGNGTEYERINAFVRESGAKNVSLYRFLPREDYDSLANACDVGLIFLDYRFTIPNFPSRLLSCLMHKKPIIACTDPNCDIGSIANDNSFGLWAPSNSVEAFSEAVDRMLQSDIKTMGENGYRFFLENYTVQHSYDAIMKHFE